MSRSEASKSPAENAYAAIRSHLLSGRLACGNHVSVLGLAKEMGIGRAAVREAVSRLANEGLLEERRGIGAIVTEPDREDIEELYEFREWVECAATEKAARGIAHEELVQLQEACHEMRAVARLFRDSGKESIDRDLYYRWNYADARFHLAIMRACGNWRAAKVLADQHLLSQTWGASHQRHDLQMLARLYREHARIMRSIRRGEVHEARELMRAHIRFGRESTLSHFDWMQKEQRFDESLLADWPESMKPSLARMEEQMGISEEERKRKRNSDMRKHT